MHITDGVLSLQVVGGSVVVGAAALGYALTGINEEDVPRISLLSGAFFVFSLISIPVGPTSIHPLLGGLLGIVLGRKAPLAIFIGLLLQVLLFQHGGITTLGVNLLLVAIPALLAGKLFYSTQRLSVFTRAALVGGLAVVGTVILLVALLLLSSPIYGEGRLSVVNILLAGYLPLTVIEALITGFAINFLYRTRPGLLQA